MQAYSHAFGQSGQNQQSQFFAQEASTRNPAQSHAQSASLDQEIGEGGYPAIEDVEPEPEPEKPEFTPEGLKKAICKQPLHKHIYRKILVYLAQEHTTEEAEAFIAAIPEFEYAIQPEGRFLDVLERAGGIERVAQQEDEGETEAEAKDASAADQAPADDQSNQSDQAAPAESQDDQAPADELASLQGATWITTDLGAAYVVDTDPLRQLRELISQDPVRTQTYLAVLQACTEAPRSLASLTTIIKEIKATADMHPSVFIDKLERAGGLYWKKAWNITEEGRACLTEFSSSQS